MASPPVDTDAMLESLTTNLLNVSSVFLVQQNELQGVRERLAKELARVDSIQEQLTAAAHQHQEAVITAVQNFESLAVAYDAAVASGAGAGAGGVTARWSTGGMSEASSAPDSSRHSAAANLGSPSPPRPPLGGAAAALRAGGSGGARYASTRTLHLPPVASTLKIFEPPPKPPAEEGEEEDEGIAYVDKLHVTGGVLGTMLSASGDFVGTPTIQWYRQHHRKGSAQFEKIEGATSLEYFPTADDVGTVLRVEATGPYGGDTVCVDTEQIAVDPSTHAKLDGNMRKGQAEFSCTSATGEQRILLITRKNIKMRSLGKITTKASTIYKQDYDLPLTIVLDAHTQTEAVLRMGAHSFPIAFETSRTRDLAALCVRMFAGPGCPTHADAHPDDADDKAAISSGDTLPTDNVDAPTVRVVVGRLART